MVKKKGSHLLVYIILIFAALLIALPFYMAVIVAFKTPLENMESFFSFPKQLYLGNFQEVPTGRTKSDFAAHSSPSSFTRPKRPG